MPLFSIRTSSGWDISKLNDLTNMFAGASTFNQNIGSWNVSNVSTMNGMFSFATQFNQNISGWSMGNVTDIAYMFQGASSFNQNISGWNVQGVTSMNYLFESATAFNQNLASWDVRTVTNMDHIFTNSGLSNTNYDNILIGWSSLSGLQSDVSLGADEKTYCAGESARAALVSSYNWFITDAGKLCTALPTVVSFTPTTGKTGTTIIINGTNFTGVSAVTFGGTNAASFTVVNATTISAVVANGATGVVGVTASGNVATSTGAFTFIPAPTITSFTPASAAAGATVTITGTNLSGATSVTFGGTAATSFAVVSATSITAVVGNGTSGSVEVITPGGTATSSGSFTFILSPTVISFTPANAAMGATVIITGTNFTGATSVTFGGTPAASFTVISPTIITAVVAGGASGSVQVITPGGTAVQPGFTFVPVSVPLLPIVKDGDNNSGNPVTSQPNDAIDLGQTFVGKDIIKTFSIENVNAVPVQVVSITLDNNNFAIVEQPEVIAANSFARMMLRLKADQAGVYSTRVAIQYQAGSFEFNVTGEVKDPSITVYNAVTPNGDGNHDFLKIVNIELYPDNSVTIINRLGEAVFKTSDYNNNDATKRFNGQGNTGASERLIDGTYYYIIDIGTKDNYTGFLLLQR